MSKGAHSVGTCSPAAGGWLIVFLKQEDFANLRGQDDAAHHRRRQSFPAPATDAQHRQRSLDAFCYRNFLARVGGLVLLNWQVVSLKLVERVNATEAGVIL